MIWDGLAYISGGWYWLLAGLHVSNRLAQAFPCGRDAPRAKLDVQVLLKPYLHHGCCCPMAKASHVPNVEQIWEGFQNPNQASGTFLLNSPSQLHTSSLISQPFVPLLFSPQLWGPVLVDLRAWLSQSTSSSHIYRLSLSPSFGLLGLVPWSLAREWTSSPQHSYSHTLSFLLTHEYGQSQPYHVWILNPK